MTNDELHPDFSISAVLSTAFSVYLRHFIPFAAVITAGAILAWAPLLAILLAGGPAILIAASGAADGRDLALLVGGTVLALLWLLVFNAWFQSALIALTAGAWEGSRPSVWESLRRGWQRLGAAVVASLLTWGAGLKGRSVTS